MKIIDEELLEPTARFFRFKDGLKYIKKTRPIVLCDK